MSINIILYPPGGGGNHLKNICCLGGRWLDQWPWSWVKEQTVGLEPYHTPQGMPGEVHSLRGRNVHEVFIDHVVQNQSSDFLLHGHFGELAPYAQKIERWTQVNWLILTIDLDLDRALLRNRQQRLQYHPYWLDEEQVYLYRQDMCVRYFGARPGTVSTLPISSFWNRDLQLNGVDLCIHRSFGVEIDVDQAQSLHDQWLTLNFSDHTRFDPIMGV